MTNEEKEDSLLVFMHEKNDRLAKENLVLTEKNVHLEDSNKRIGQMMLYYDRFVHELETHLLVMGASHKVIDKLKERAKCP